VAPHHPVEGIPDRAFVGHRPQLEDLRQGAAVGERLEPALEHVLDAVRADHRAGERGERSGRGLQPRQDALPDREGPGPGELPAVRAGAPAEEDLDRGAPVGSLSGKDQGRLHEDVRLGGVGDEGAPGEREAREGIGVDDLHGDAAAGARQERAARDGSRQNRRPGRPVARMHDEIHDRFASAPWRG
jgi:hypothetical protein